jgi:hypothetical protein
MSDLTPRRRGIALKCFLWFVAIYMVFAAVALFYISAVNWGTDYSAWRNWGMMWAYGIQIGFIAIIAILAILKILTPTTGKEEVMSGPNSFIEALEQAFVTPQPAPEKDYTTKVCAKCCKPVYYDNGDVTYQCGCRAGWEYPALLPSQAQPDAVPALPELELPPLDVTEGDRLLSLTAYQGNAYQRRGEYLVCRERQLLSTLAQLQEMREDLGTVRILNNSLGGVLDDTKAQLQSANEALDEERTLSRMLGEHRQKLELEVQSANEQIEDLKLEVSVTQDQVTELEMSIYCDDGWKERTEAAEIALQSANERAAHWARENSEKQRLFDEAIAQRDAAEARLAQPELKAEGPVAWMVEREGFPPELFGDFTAAKAMFAGATRKAGITPLYRAKAALRTKSGLGEDER